MAHPLCGGKGGRPCSSGQDSWGSGCTRAGDGRGAAGGGGAALNLARSRLPDGTIDIRQKGKGKPIDQRALTHRRALHVSHPEILHASGAATSTQAGAAAETTPEVSILTQSAFFCSTHPSSPAMHNAHPFSPPSHSVCRPLQHQLHRACNQHVRRAPSHWNAPGRCWLSKKTMTTATSVRERVSLMNLLIMRMSRCLCVATFPKRVLRVVWFGLSGVRVTGERTHEILLKSIKFHIVLEQVQIL